MDILKYIDRSKSQLSVALKKLETAEYIRKSNTRPLIISITKKGDLLKQKIFKEILKYREIKKNNSIIQDQVVMSKQKRINQIPNKRKEHNNFKANCKYILKKK